ncbi:TlpA disulfide reductase family protein [Hwanghaeella sp.]|uniref:TlpA disulfide reductase family protein n=1 Tax=Hwanghaeella sp. TaxID=2605943 RepID=UPI003CCBE134
MRSLSKMQKLLFLFLLLFFLAPPYGGTDGGNGIPVDGPAAHAADLQAGAAIVGGSWYGDPPALTGEKRAFTWRWKPTRIPPYLFDRVGSTEKVSLADFEGKVVLVNVWATWCPPCVAEMPALDNLQLLRGGEDFAVVAISVDSQGPDIVTAFLDKHGLENLAPYIGKGRETFDHFRMSELPTTFLLGRDGSVWGAMAGPAEWDSREALALIDYAIGLTPGY